MSKKKLAKILNNFKDKKIGIVGDVMLDRFIWGDVDRVSQEAPIPIVRFEKEVFIPGGAGNVAANIASLSGVPFLVGAVGRDTEGGQLLKALRTRNVNTRGVTSDRGRYTVQKTRIMARGQHMIRLDKENIEYLTPTQEKRLISFIAENMSDWDGVVISDYAKGVASGTVIRETIRLAKKHQKFIVGDTKLKDVAFFKGVTVLKPNDKEAYLITGTNDVIEAGKRIEKKLQCAVLITQGAKGMVLFKKNKARHFPVKAREVYDATGAGDTVIAALALALVAGASLEEAVHVANHAAGIVVGKVGVSTVSFDDLRKSLENDL